MSYKFSILYTHQKQKKHKVWQDGILTVKSDGQSVEVQDDKSCIITSFTKKKDQTYEPGDEFECSKYLIQIDDVYVEKNLPKNKLNVLDALSCNNESSEDGSGKGSNVPKFKKQLKRKYVFKHQNLNSEESKKSFRKPFCVPKSINGCNYSHASAKENKNETTKNEELSLISKVPSIFSSVDDFEEIASSGNSSNLENKSSVNISKKEHQNIDTDLQQKNGTDTKSTRRKTMEVLALLNGILPSDEEKNDSMETNQANMESANSKVLFNEQVIKNQNDSNVKRDFKSPQMNLSLQERFCKDLFFPSLNDHILMTDAVVRNTVIPTRFTNAKEYGDTLIMAVTEHINLTLFNASKSYHWVMSQADLTGYTCGKSWKYIRNEKAKQLSKLSNVRQIQSYLKRSRISCYCECSFVRKADNYQKSLKMKNVPAWVKSRNSNNPFDDVKKKLYLQLPFKEASSVYNKNDIWVVSHNLNFEPKETFVAKSAFYGPSTDNLLEIQPMTGYSSSMWHNGGIVYALHICNASTELSSIKNIQNNVIERQFPLLPHLLCNFENDTSQQVGQSLKRKFNLHRNSIPLNTKKTAPLLPLDYNEVKNCVESFISAYNLNEDQALALASTAEMLCYESKTKPPVLLIHGVFGSGKSFLLSVLILFLAEMAQKQPKYDWKILLASTTNVAVDRVLNCLLDAQFTNICRIGSFKKISHRILPYSVHTKDKNEQIKELQSMMANKDISPKEKMYIRKSLEQVRLGVTKQLLSDALVVGATCASTTFPYLASFKFPIVIIDECTQVTEPNILLPLAPFACQYALLVGDPNQLPPTIEGPGSAHSQGLEQTMFNRLHLLDYEPVKLRTQYRCHPDISHVANTLFYNNDLKDGVIDAQRTKLVERLPHLMFYDMTDSQENRDDYSGSFYNQRESTFISELVKMLLSFGIPGTEIGVIALYKSQVSKIKSDLQALSLTDLSDVSYIQVSTVDAFQGAEKNIIILSCVRTTTNNFVENKERMCVALTRAKVHLLVVGHVRSLKKSQHWSKVIKICGKNIQTPFHFRKIWGKRLAAKSEQAE